MNPENFSPSTLANTVSTSAKPPLVIHIFSPFRTQWFPSSLNRAVDFAASASDPEPDSLKQYALIHSPEPIFGKYFCFCSSVPKRTIGSSPILLVAPKPVENEASPDRCSAINIFET